MSEIAFVIVFFWEVHQCVVVAFLSEKNKNQRLGICTGLLVRHQVTHDHVSRFLYKIIADIKNGVSCELETAGEMGMS